MLKMALCMRAPWLELQEIGSTQETLPFSTTCMVSRESIDAGICSAYNSVASLGNS